MSEQTRGGRGLFGRRVSLLVVRFVDNVSAAMALIKGASAKADLSAIAVAIHAVFARLRVRVWVEYVESASSPADGLSRAGLEDAWTRAQGWTLKEVPCPDFFRMETATVDSLRAIVDGALSIYRTKIDFFRSVSFR